MLERVCSNKNSCTLLVGQQNGTSLEDYSAVSYKVRCKSAYNKTIPPLGSNPREMKRNVHKKHILNDSINIIFCNRKKYPIEDRNHVSVHLEMVGLMRRAGVNFPG